MKKKVNEETFWRKAAEIVKLAEPLVKVLRLVDGERLVMGFIHEAMDQAKEQIKRAYKDRVAKWHTRIEWLSMGPFGQSMMKDGTINFIALYMQLGIF